MKTIPLTQGKTALVDDEDYLLVSQFKWHCNPHHKGRKIHWRARARVNGNHTYMHLLLTRAAPGQIVDHKNGNGLDNRKENLRICTRVQNSVNSTARVHSSKYKGVRYLSSRKAWGAEIGFKGKGYNLGYFKNEEDAAIVYNVAAQIFYGEFARLNEV